MITGITTILVALVLIIAPIYIGIHYSQKSAKKRREEEENRK